MYRYGAPLDIERMRRAAALLEGEHDFTAFCANRRMKKSAVRRLESIVISENGGELRFELTGDGFLYNMVRIIVGTLIEVGAHSRAAEDMPAILASKDRERAGYTAPAQGLSLWQVRY